MPARSNAPWHASDLIRRVIKALDTAAEAVETIVAAGAAQTAPIKIVDGVPCDKVVAETAMLLLCVAPIRRRDGRIGERVDALAALLIPHARHRDVLGAICLDPGQARDHAVAHAVLSRLGCPDRDVDALLAQSLAMGPDFGPERLPHRQLEQQWLARVWRVGGMPTRHDARLLADSMLGRPLDALGGSRLDFYAFTHAVMYATDLGERRITLPRPAAAIATDADAALAYGLDTDDYDLTAETLLTWPMLGLTWSPAAIFAFRVLAEAEDDLGFLPGSTFDPSRHQALTGAAQSRFALATSYHTAYVMGFLCAVALRQGRTPPATVPQARRARGAAAALLPLIPTDARTACWHRPFSALTARQQDAVAPLVVAALLRRARTAGNLQRLREVLEVALAHDLIEGPAPQHAAALLRRSRALIV